ncbi:fibrinogen-like protein 1 isoform X2 [Drosophila nasuta]|uniref:fibrinogen-like protein 1 isoform X2 n=2 Tax=Drosophila nasuta TaxID=42062 RepID=UPI00295E4C26|nr:fibrinogen-like protein 1 isoform X2 [Drosophila nasuta]
MNWNLLLFILILVHNCYATDLECDNQCSWYCYQVAKPLLQYAKKAQEKERELLKLTEINRKLNEEKAALAKQLVEKNEELKFYKNDRSSCLDKKTGIQEMRVSYVHIFPVPCDSELVGSGWTVIQRRKDASESFNRGWTDYRRGFGNLENNFFIGLEKLYLLTSQKPHELYIYLKSSDNEVRHAKYSVFKIAGESENYKLLSVGNFSGNANDSLSGHVNMNFSTYDRDNDESKYNCALEWLSGWWFAKCFYSNLNGLYKDNVINLHNGIRWNSWNSGKELTFVQMMIRPIIH